MSSCSFMCHRLLFHLFFKVSTTIPIPTSQVCLRLNYKLNWNLTWPLSHATFCSVTVVQVIDVSFCNVSYSHATSHLLWSLTALRFVFAVMVLTLAVISTLKESVALYKATKQWQPNCHMQQLVKDGILYFLVYVSPFPFLSFPSHPPSIFQVPAKKKNNHSELLGM